MAKQITKIMRTYRINKDIDAVIKSDSKRLRISQAEMIETSVHYSHVNLFSKMTKKTSGAKITI